MTVRILKPVRTGTDIRLEARIVSFAPTAAEVTMSIHAPDGTCLAEAESTWAFPRLSRIATLAGVEENVLQQFLDDCQRIE